MRIAVDLDDVLADLISCLLLTHRELTGEILTREDAIAWDVFPAAVHDHVRYNGGYATLRPLPYGREFLSSLRSKHEIHIVTYRGKHAESATLAWLDDHLPGLYDSVHLTGGSKVETCRQLGIGLIVDDSCNQVPAVTDALRIPGILVETPMNRHIAETDLIHRAGDLREACEIIKRIIGQS